VTDTELIIQLY